MSHLSRHQNKELIKKLGFFLIGIALLSFAAFQIGLKSIINTTLLLNNVISGSTTAEDTEVNEAFFGTLRVDDPPNATNSAEIFISGDAGDFDNLVFYINNTKVEETKAKDSFNEKIGKLRAGENTIYVVAQTTKGNNKKESEKYTVFYKNQPPTLEVNTPKEGDTVSKQEIQLEGKTDTKVNIWVNNQPVVVDYQGNFKKSYRLKEGENKLLFLAEDEAGNTEQVELTVKYQKDE